MATDWHEALTGNRMEKRMEESREAIYVTSLFGIILFVK
jgi:hypothetical protein